MLGAVEAQLDDFDMLQLKLVWWALGRLSVRPKRNVLELFFGRITGLLVDLDALVRAAADSALCAICLRSCCLMSRSASAWLRASFV